MKKTYETPVAEKVCFNYKEQVVASGSSACYWVGHTTRGYQGCTEEHTGSMNK
ncbi:hypothetical protein [Blautia sp. MSJ-9]|uniref:hypothetical protein n=1 Tax=Blautia sp. MSJ-9 TaxID=2841511 RepID=UPI001C1272EA|nr:hypothetical protein [Blautia sp. MSJ-9]MBU5681123.1 hypothetical protein [Blautia sp. MSJ-9]